MCGENVGWVGERVAGRPSVAIRGRWTKEKEHKLVARLPVFCANWSERSGGGPVDQRECVGVRVGVGGVDRRVETKICSTETGPKLKNYVHDG